MFITEKELAFLIKESIKNVLSESTQKLVDNFDVVANIINLSDPDQFFFVQILKRWKDNKDKGMVKKTDGTYHGGAEYGNYQNGTAFKIRSAQDLLALKPKIIQLCNADNSRAYITCNPRSDAEISAFLPQFKTRFKDPNDPRIIHAEELLAGQAKGEGAMASERPRFFFDVDTTDKRIWGITKMILRRFNIPIEMEYTTPSEGLHIVIPDRNVKDMNKVIFYLRMFDGPLYKKIIDNFDFDDNGDNTQEESHIVNIILKVASSSNAQRCFPNKGKLQMVHANFDGKLILYSNVITAGY